MLTDLALLREFRGGPKPQKADGSQRERCSRQGSGDVVENVDQVIRAPAMSAF
jgi:hypothetical protein